MQRVMRLVIRYVEPLVVVLILASVVFIHFLVAHKVTMIAFYFLPVLLAGYTHGQRLAVATAVFSVAVVMFWVIVRPSSFALPGDSMSLYAHLAAWSGFLILSAVVVGRLYAEKEKRLVDLRASYAGILEILFAYLESPRKGLRSHVAHVADMSGHIAVRLRMSDEEVEVIRTAALLHEIKRLQVPLDLVQRAADLSLREIRMMELHCQEGGAILQRLGSLLRAALPTVVGHRELCAAEGSQAEDPSQVSWHVQILHVADTYDVLTESQGRSPADAASEIMRTLCRWVHPDVLEAFAKVAELSQIGHAERPGQETNGRHSMRPNRQACFSA